MLLTIKETLQLLRIIVVEFLLEVLGYIIVPIALVFTKKEDDHLPKWARWLEDAHDYYEGQCAAINGDSGWRNEHYPEPKNRTFWARLMWLYRNRIGYFSSQVNGVEVAQIDPTSVTTIGDIHVTDNKGEKSSWCKVTCRLKNGKTRFGLYKIIKYSDKYYCRLYLGWKLMDIAGMTESNYQTFIEADDKKWLKSVWAIHPLKRVQDAKK